MKINQYLQRPKEWQVKYLLFTLLIVFSLYAKGQKKFFSGVILDGSNGRAIEGATVSLTHSSRTTITDSNGKFSIGADAAIVRAVITHLSYSKDTVQIVAGVPVRIVLRPLGRSLAEVTVNVRNNTSTEQAVLEERRKSSTIQDAISAQQIERTASITVTQALQRVTGVTVTDDKYVAIRGLGDRSVIGQLNGVRLASSDPDRSTLPLDLLPASLLDNITVYKTFTPDKPADAASGIVELKTKSIPEARVLQFRAYSGFNSEVGLGGRYNSFINSAMGFSGSKINDKNLSEEFLGLSSKYPGGLPEIQRVFANANLSPENRKEADRINGMMQGFDPVMTTRYRRAPVDQQYAVSFGDNYNVFKKHRLGVILGANYYRRYKDIYQGELSQYSVYQGVLTGSQDIFSPRNIPNYITPNNINLGRYQTYRENTGTETLNYGVLGGLAYRFSPLHEISGQFMGNWGGETRASNMKGSYDYSGLPGIVESSLNSLQQTFRNLFVYNLQGEHKFSHDPYSPHLSWNAAISRSKHNDPDFRFTSLTTYTPDDTSYTRKYVLASGYVNGYGPYGIIQAEPNGRRWRQLNERDYNYKMDLTLPFPFLSKRQELKLGANLLYRERNYSENHLFIPGSNFTVDKNKLLYEVNGNLDRLVSNEYVGINPNAPIGEGGVPVSGFIYNPLKSPNNYRGFNDTKAFYGMLDLRLTDHFRVAGGVRFESTDIASKVDTSQIFLDPALSRTNPDGTRLPLVMINPNSRYKPGFKPYYSVNLTYSLRPEMNLRLAYNKTLARPELREITNVFQYDPYQLGLVVGNPNLVNQTNHNLDLRWEWFTGIGEVLSVSAFGKRIHNQLVKVYSLKTRGQDATYPEYPVIQFQNEQNVGKVWGLEAEFSRNLGRVWDPLNHFFLGLNLMVSQSDIKKGQARYDAGHTLDRNAPRNSPLFEQAPYAINAWLNYARPAWGTDLTITFNVVGERLVQINLLGEPDLYSQPAPMLDFVFSQRLAKRLTFKGFAKNVLNPAYRTVYANPGTGGRWYGREYVQRSYQRGAEFMLGLSYNIY